MTGREYSARSQLGVLSWAHPTSAFFFLSRPSAAIEGSFFDVTTSRKVVLAEGRLGEYGPGFLRAGFCLPRLVFRPKLQHGQLRGRRQNPGVSTLFSKIIQAGFLRGPLLHAESQESAFRV